MCYTESKSKKELLFFQSGEEALHSRVIIAFACTAEALDNAVVAKQLPVRFTGVLTSAV